MQTPSLPPPRPVRQLALLPVLIIAVGCQGPNPCASTQREPSDPSLQPFTQAISGTTVTFDMIPVPARTVELVNAAGATRSVAVQPFWIASTETTWDLYDVWVYELDKPAAATTADAITRPSRPYIPPDLGFGHAGYPAISLTYHAATEFCKWLSIKTGRRYRLPTEAEWMAASDHPASLPLEDREWFEANAARTTHPVARKAPNPLGLYDTLGNVAEWIVTDSEKPIAAGGCYLDPSDQINPNTRRTQDRAWNETDPQIPKSAWWLSDCSFVGFRIVCEAENTESPGGSTP